MRSEINSCNRLQEKMCECLGFNTVFYDTVKNWYRIFKTGNSGIDYEPHSGLPIAVDCDQLKQINIKPKYFSTRTIALELDVFQNTIANDLKEIKLTFMFN